jgi:hypothetical protein
MTTQRAGLTFAGVALEETCDECKGAGWPQSPGWQRWFEAGQPAGKEPRDGFGELAPQEYVCSECEGHGVGPAVVGSALLEFVRRWLG